MSTKNKTNLLGNLGEDPKVFTFTDGNEQISFPIATQESYYSKEKGEMVQLPTQWHNIIVKKPNLINYCKLLKVGSRVDIEGSLNYRKYTKDEQTNYITEIVAIEVINLTTKPE